MLLSLTIISAFLYASFVEYCLHRFVQHRSFEIDHIKNHQECVHLYSHKSANVFLERLEVFRILKEHHRVHHYIYNSNYGIGSTIWDSVFRTKKVANKTLEAIMIRNR